MGLGYGKYGLAGHVSHEVDTAPRAFVHIFVIMGYVIGVDHNQPVLFVCTGRGRNTASTTPRFQLLKDMKPYMTAV